MISLSAFDPALSRTHKIDKYSVESAIYLIRGQRVMLDSDLAEIYGVSTRQLNQQLRHNLDRFPEDFAFQLRTAEFRDLMSQIVTSKKGRGGRRKLPWVFTEHGVIMLGDQARWERPQRRDQNKFRLIGARRPLSHF